MKKVLKEESFREWMEYNPGKTERDWLIEERCINNTQRADLKRLFDWADLNHRIIKVCPTVGLIKDPNGPYHQVVRTNHSRRGVIRDLIHGENTHIIHPIIGIKADFQVIGTYDLYYDLDAPDNVFEQSKPDLYLNWKAQQMDIDPISIHTNYELYEAFKPYMGANIPHWRSLITNQKYNL